MTWERINEDAYCWTETHLFRYEPSVVGGGAWLKDHLGNNWAIRTCAICGERERRQVDEGADILDVIAPVETTR